MSRVLQIATRLFITQKTPSGEATDYDNIMMTIPNAFSQWEIEWRDYCAQWGDPQHEVDATVEMVRTELTLAFQFSPNYIR